MRPFSRGARAPLSICIPPSFELLLETVQALRYTPSSKQPMDVLSEQADLGRLLYEGVGSTVSLQQNLAETPPSSAFSSSQTETVLAQGGGDTINGLQTVNNTAGTAKERIDETSQPAEEARLSNLESSGALDIAARRSLLLGRMKQKHICHVCRRECPSKHKLKRHLSTHSEERPFNCHICGKSFKWTEYLTKHMRQQHDGAQASSEGKQDGGTSTTSDLTPELTARPAQRSQGSGIMEGCNTSIDVAMETSMDSAMCVTPGLSHKPAHALAFAGSLQLQQDSPIAATSTPPAPPPLQDGTMVDPQASSQELLPTHTIPPPELIPVQPSLLPPSLPPTTHQISPDVQSGCPDSELMQQFGIPIPENTQPLSHPHMTLPVHSNAICNHSYPAVSLPSTPLEHGVHTYPMELTTQHQSLSQVVSVLSNMTSGMPETNFEVQMRPSCVYDSLDPGMVLNAANIQVSQMQMQTADMSAVSFEPTIETTLANETLPTTAPPTSHATTTTLVSEMEKEPPTKRPRKETISVGIQCEVGNETIIALREEERARAQGLYTGPQTDLEIDANAIHVSDGADQPVVMGLSQEAYAEQYGVDGTMDASGEQVLSPLQRDEKVIHKYPCEMEDCTKAYVHRKDLIRHMKIRHGISPKKLEPIAMETPEKPYGCLVAGCGRSYFHMKDLRRHQRQCHIVSLSHDQLSGDPINGDGRGMMRFPCDFPGCVRSYVHKKDLVRHKRLYHKDSSTKPTVPLALRYTEAELKKTKQEEKVDKEEGEDRFEKSRLNSTGSTVSTCGAEDPPNSATLTETDQEMPDPSSSSDLNSLNASEIMDSLHTRGSMASMEGFQATSCIIASATTNALQPAPTAAFSTVAHTDPITTPHMSATAVLTHETIPQDHLVQQLNGNHQLTSPDQIASELCQAVYSTGNTANFAYNIGAFSNTGNNTMYNFAEHPSPSTLPQHTQLPHDAMNTQYDPSSMLNTLATTSATGPLQGQSLQNVVNSFQLFTSTQGPGELHQGTF